MTNIQKCGVIGVGFVGATCAYTLAVSGLFSDLVLVDMNRDKAIGEAADINHGVAFSKPCRVMAGDYADLAECGLIIIAAGANQKPGESRLELLGRNKGILSSVIAQLTAVNREAILLVVSNPVDVLTCLAQQLSGFPAGRVLGSGTVLDTARLKYLLGQRLGVDSRNVHAFIIGEHGDSELAVWSSANISGADLDDYCRIAGIAEAIVRNEHSVLPVTSMIYGHYGVDGICLGVPTIVGRNGAEAVLDIPLSQEELAQLQRSANTMREMIDKLDG